MRCCLDRPLPCGELGRDDASFKAHCVLHFTPFRFRQEFEALILLLLYIASSMGCSCGCKQAALRLKRACLPRRGSNLNPEAAAAEGIRVAALQSAGSTSNT